MSTPTEQVDNDTLKLKNYATQKLDAVFRDMLQALLKATPDDPVQYMIEYLSDYKKKRQSDMDGLISDMQETAGTNGDSYEDDNHDDAEEEEEEEEEIVPDEDAAVARPKRNAVSAESVKQEDMKDAKTRNIPKSDEDTQGILEAVKSNLLFKHLDSNQLSVVVSAMERKEYKQGDVIIRQGDDGDEFFLLQQGQCDCFLNQKDGSMKKVKEYKAGESFGELALMYNCPRAATIVAVSDDVVAWAMDRLTFRAVLMSTTSAKRERYENFLTSVPLLESLDRYERAKIADAIADMEFKDGDFIIKQGESSDDHLYFIVEGAAKATKVLEGSEEPTVVMEYNKPGDYFGELALLYDMPRAANVIAVGDVKLVSLDRGSFTRLLGPLTAILNRNRDNYAEIEKKITAAKAQASS